MISRRKGITAPSAKRLSRLAILVFTIAHLTGVVPNEALGATLHAIIVADTARPELTTGAEQSMKIMRALTLSVSKYTDLDLNPQTIDGERVSKTRILDSVRGLAVTEEDTVLFYYVGHGVRSDRGNLPKLWVGEDASDAVDANELVSILEGKSPRLLITVIEACNREGNPYSSVPSGARPLSPERGHYRRLFLKSEGSLIAMAAQPGEYAYLNRSAGGYFTDRFIESISKETSWPSIRDALEEPIYISRKTKQSPLVFWQGTIEQHVASPPGPEPASAPEILSMVQVAPGTSVGKSPVTVGQYKRFIQETGHDSAGACRLHSNGWKKSSSHNWRNPDRYQSDDHPVVCVSYDDAMAFVSWLRRKTNRDYRLLSLDLWRRLAANASIRNAVCDGCGGYASTAEPVGSRGVDENGLYDIIGNVWQWMGNCPIAESKCPVRGGAWLDEPKYLRERQFSLDRHTGKTNALGFRVMRYD